MTSVFIISPISWDSVIVIRRKVLPAYIRRTVRGGTHEQRRSEPVGTELGKSDMRFRIRQNGHKKSDIYTSRLRSPDTFVPYKLYELVKIFLGWSDEPQRKVSYTILKSEVPIQYRLYCPMLNSD